MATMRYDDAPMVLASGFTWSDGAGGTLRERDGREVRHLLHLPATAAVYNGLTRIFTCIYIYILSYTVITNYDIEMLII